MIIQPFQMKSNRATATNEISQLTSLLWNSLCANQNSLKWLKVCAAKIIVQCIAEENKTNGHVRYMHKNTFWEQGDDSKKVSGIPGINHRIRQAQARAEHYDLPPIVHGLKKRLHHALLDSHVCNNYRNANHLLQSPCSRSPIIHGVYTNDSYIPLVQLR